MSVFNFWVNELNQESFKKYRKYTAILAFSSLALKLISDFPFFEIVFFGICIFLVVISLKALYSEKFRPLILNGNSKFENTKYILYFFIYTGIGGALLSGFMLFGFAQKII